MKYNLKTSKRKVGLVSILTLSMTLSMLGSSAFAEKPAPMDILPQSLGLSVEGLRYTVTASLLGKIDSSKFGIKDAVLEAPKKSTDKESRKFYIHYKLSDVAGPNNEHMIFFIPGFGGKNDGGPTNFFIELLTKQGFSVVCFDSPPSERFLKESSRFGIPGVQNFDAQDLYEGMQVAKDYFQKNRENAIMPFSKYSVVGTSLGGLNASQIELLSIAKGAKLNFHRVISINPPMSNVYGMSLIDYFVKNYKERTTSSGQSIGVVPTIISAVYNNILKTFKYEDLEDRVDSIVNPHVALTKDQAQMLIGLSFSETVGGTAAGFKFRHPEFDAISDKKKFGDFVTFYDIYDRITIPMLKELGKQKITDYEMPHFEKENDAESRVNTNKKFLSAIRNSNEPDLMTRADDIQIDLTSIRANAKELSAAPNYVLLTYEDDFLLRNNMSTPKAFDDDDKSWINRTFNGKYDASTNSPTKARSYVFFQGGHLGGYYQKQFQNMLIGFLSEK